LVVLRGEIDIHTAPDINHHLGAIPRTVGADLLIDLRRVEFMDCAGVELLHRARARAHDRYGHLRLICNRRGILRLLNSPVLHLDFDIVDRMPAPVPPQAAA